MATIRVGIEINKGKRGVPLAKLAQIVGAAQKFLHMLSEDLDLPSESDSWLGLDFSNGSVAFSAEKAEPVSIPQMTAFNAAFVSIIDKRPDPSLRRATVAQYAEIADPIGIEEEVTFRLFEAELPPRLSQGHFADAFYPQPIAALRSFALTKSEAVAIHAEVQAKVRAYGSLQGRIHSLFLRSTPPYFNLRELSSRTLIKCTYRPDKYDDIATALKTQNAVLHVFGFTTTDLVQRKMEELEVEKVIIAPVMSENDFENLFGAHPHFTGRLTTQEFIDRVRGRVQ